MKPVDPVELSAMLDGELAPHRADEVCRVIAENPSLRRHYEELAALDADLKAHARAAIFRPRVSIARRPPAYSAGIIPIALALVALRVVLKIVSPLLGTALEIAVLVCSLTWVLRRLVIASEEELRRSGLSAASTGS